MTRHQSGEPDLPPGPARELVDLFRRLRRGRPLSGGQLAMAAGLSAGHVSQVLRGVKAPSPQAAAKIAQCLGATSEQARKAYQLAEQLRELNRYHRARGRPPTLPRPAARPDFPLRPYLDDHSQPPAARDSPAQVQPTLPRPAARPDFPLRPYLDDHSQPPAARDSPAQVQPTLPRPAARPDFPLRPRLDDHSQPPAARDSPAQVRPVVDVFPVAIGHYADPGLPDLDAQGRAGRLVDLLAPFGGVHRPWRHPAHGRGADAVQHRLREWSRPPTSPGGSRVPGDDAVYPAVGSSVLYWPGHGWADGARAALAHAESPAEVGESGLEPHQLAQAIRARQAGAGARQETGEAGGWALVVLEGGHATQVADAVMAALHGPDAPARLLLVAVPPDGSAPAGGFADVLAALLAGTYRADRQILLRDLAAQLERLLGPRNVYQRALGEAALVRAYPPVASWMSAPVDTIRHLEEVLAELPADERNHFLVKAQGAEHGELAWFFQGRENELAQIAAWLHQAGSGLLVVTGRAGSGKSALLGTAVVRSVPALRDALARRGLVPAPRPGPEAPPESVFDAVIHLRGLDLGQATERIAMAARAGPLPSRRDHAAGVASDLDFLASELAGRRQPFTVLADALDESADPLNIARALLARIAALPGVRVVAGTRASTREAPDTPADDENLLDALGVSVTGTRIQAGRWAAGETGPAEPGVSQVIWIGQDQQAISRYVTARLRAARDHGLAGRAVAHMAEVSDRDIERAAAEVAGRGQEFLFARLAVYELIADPRLLTPGMAHSRGRLLQGTHQDLFGRAVHRLASHDDRYPVLLRALSLARGRGIPEADGIWSAIAAVLAPPVPTPADAHPGPDPVPGAAAAWAQAISGLLGLAAAYITADTSPGRDPALGTQTVYRLAHHTFVEYFATHPPPGPDGGDPHALTAGALLHAAQTAIASPGQLPAYLFRHLSGHAAEADMWEELAGLPRVLDRIDPSAVTTDAIRTLFGRAVPPLIAGVIGARDTLAAAAPADRPGLRQLATTIHSPRRVVGEPVTGWGIAAARAGHTTVHVTLSGHTSTVNRVISLNLPDGRTVVASCSDDGTIRLWDPVTATPVGVPMAGHDGTVEDICVLPLPHRVTVLASAGVDGTLRLWDPATGQPAGPPLTGHAGPFWFLCVVPGRPGQPPALASSGDDGAVRLWDPATGQPASPPLTGHTGPVWAACMVPGRPGQPPTLASAGVDGTVRLWDPATGQPTAPPLTGHTAPIRGVCVVPGPPDQPPALASAADDGTVRLWDLATGQPATPALTGHTGPVVAVCAVPGQPPALASAGEDGTVRLWDPATGQPTAPPLTGHTGPVRGVCAVPGRPGRPPVLASAGEDGTVRLWDPATGQPTAPAQTGPVRGVYAVPGRPRQPPVPASVGDDGATRLPDPATGQAPIPASTGPNDTARPTAPAAGRPPALASAGEDGTARLRDPATGQPTAPPQTGYTGPVWGVCAVPGRPGQPPVLASAGEDGTVRLWDPATGQPAAPPLTGHTGPVRSVYAVPGRADQPPALASAGEDGTVRLWDPATGQPAAPPLTGHTGPVRSVYAVAGQPRIPASAGSDDTTRPTDPAIDQAPTLASTRRDGTVHPGDPATGQPPALARAEEDDTVRLRDPATGQAPIPASTSNTSRPTDPATGQSPALATAGENEPLRLGDPATGRAPKPASTEPSNTARPTDPAIGQAPILASTGRDGTVRLWNLATGQPAGPPLTGHTGPIRGVCTVPGRLGQPPVLASAGIDGTVRLWDLATGQPIGSPLTGHTGPVMGVCVVPGQSGEPPVLATAGVDGTIRLWDLAAGQPAGPPLTGPTSPVYSVCVVPSGPGQAPVLASAWSDGTVRLWDVAAGQLAGPPLTGHSGSVVGVCVVPGWAGELPVLASAGVDGTIRLWDVATGRAVGQPMIRSPEAVSGLAPGPDTSSGCVTMHGDGTVHTWTPATAALHGVPSPPDVSAIATLAVRGHVSLLTGDAYGHLHLSDPRTGDQPGPAVRVDHRAVLALCPLPGPPPAARVAVASGSGTITIVTAGPGGRLEPGPILRGHAGPIRALCPIEYPPGRHLMAAAGNDATITIWDLTTPAASPPAAPVAGPITGHDGWIWSLAAIPARPGAPPRLASAGADHTIRLWDPVSGRPLGPPLTGHTGQVRAIIAVASEDGRVVLASGGHDGTVRLWDPVTGTPGTVIPLGIPVHALLQQRPDPASRERTGGGATITAGLRTGILALDLHRDLFPAAQTPRSPNRIGRPRGVQ